MLPDEQQWTSCWELATYCLRNFGHNGWQLTEVAIIQICMHIDMYRHGQIIYFPLSFWYVARKPLGTIRNAFFFLCGPVQSASVPEFFVLLVCWLFFNFFMDSCSAPHSFPLLQFSVVVGFFSFVALGPGMRINFQHTQPASSNSKSNRNGNGNGNSNKWLRIAEGAGTETCVNFALYFCCQMF